ncbi:Methyl viologen resistance protein YddG [Serratia fonticola]|uniref:Methyl viologen resistance protein YddG n=1 Tax=Serratia fonticola TaxID=47917 RepID=A0A4U9WJD7_SERFO|nr:Methyl viologen resistance protein YddG [Serratia fonticola]
MIYSVGTLFLLVVMGIPKLREFRRSYLILGSLLFVLYEICLFAVAGLCQQPYAGH